MAPSSSQKSKASYFAFRLAPHQDLKKGLINFVEKNKLKAGFILTCVGSLEQVSIRFANQENGVTLTGHFEIVSLTGTFSDTYTHFHIAVAGVDGNAIGGHLLEGSRVYTTAELVLGEMTEVEFNRITDTTYGYKELNVIKRPKKK
jgi:hypothetical protein